MYACAYKSVTVVIILPEVGVGQGFKTNLFLVQSFSLAHPEVQLTAEGIHY